MNRLKYIECRYCTEVKELFQKDNLSGEYFKIDTNAKCDLISIFLIFLFRNLANFTFQQIFLIIELSLYKGAQ